MSDLVILGLAVMLALSVSLNMALGLKVHLQRKQIDADAERIEDLEATTPARSWRDSVL